MHHANQTIPCVWEALEWQQRGSQVHYIGVDIGVIPAYFLFSLYNGLAGLFSLPALNSGERDGGLQDYTRLDHAPGG